MSAAVKDESAEATIERLRRQLLISDIQRRNAEYLLEHGLPLRNAPSSLERREDEEEREHGAGKPASTKISVEEPAYFKLVRVVGRTIRATGDSACTVDLDDGTLVYVELRVKS